LVCFVTPSRPNPRLCPKSQSAAAAADASGFRRGNHWWILTTSGWETESGVWLEKDSAGKLRRRAATAGAQRPASLLLVPTQLRVGGTPGCNESTILHNYAFLLRLVAGIGSFSVRLPLSSSCSSVSNPRPYSVYRPWGARSRYNVGTSPLSAYFDYSVRAAPALTTR
jgi:hypothetical protein